MKKTSIKTAVLCGFALAAFSPFSLARAASPLAFNEIMYALPGTDSGREWIELKNTSNQPVSLKGGSTKDALRLSITSGENQTAYRLASQAYLGSLTVEPQSYLIVAVDAPTFMREHPLFNGSVVDCCGKSSSTSPLPNSAALVQIKDGAGAVVAEAYYSNVLGAWQNGKTLEFDGNSWREGLHDGGTPGQENSVVGLILPAASSPIPPPSPTPTPPKTPSSSPTKSIPPKSSASPPTASTPPPGQNFDSLRALVISEFLPNPPGQDRLGEWIELANTGKDPVVLKGIQLTTDSSKKPYVLSGSLGPFGYKVIRRTESGLSLKNGGGTLRLIDWEGKQIFEISYGDGIPANWSAARFADVGWKITQKPTPGQANVLVQDQKKRDALATVPSVQEKTDGKTQTFISPEPEEGSTHGAPAGALLFSGLAMGGTAAGIVLYLKRRAG